MLLIQSFHLQKPLKPQILFFNYQWGLKNGGHTILDEIDDIRSTEVPGEPGMDLSWSQIRKDFDQKVKKNIVVAVIDSGVDIDHPDIQENLSWNLKECDKDRKIPFSPDEDKDGNGYKGDCLGWNFTNERSGQNRPLDDLGHGTHVSGIIAAEVNNGRGISGVSNKLKILPVKVLFKEKKKKKRGETEGGGLKGFSDRLAKGILYATKMKADVINLSLGWPNAADTQHIREAFKEALSQGITIVAAAGNNNMSVPLFPCSYKGVICVGSIDADGKISSFSNFGGHVDILAPGDNILSLYPTTQEPLHFSIKGYEIKNGTSQAAPYVSATAGILKGIFPEITPDEIKARLFLSSKSVNNLEKFVQHGTTRLKEALEVPKSPVVRPVFKELRQISYQWENKKFPLEFFVKNYWAKAKNVEISVIGKTPSIEFPNSSFSFAEIKSGETKNIRVEGSILDISAHSEFHFEVIVKVEGEVQGRFTQLVSVARKIDNDPEIFSIPAPLSQRLSEKKDPTKNLNVVFNNVKNFYDEYAYPEYFYSEKLDHAVKVVVLKLQAGKFVEQKELIIPKARRLLAASAFRKIDINYDGRPEYMIETVAKEQPDSKDKKDKKSKPSFVQFSFYDEDMNPLFGEHSHWKVNIEDVLMTMKGAHFLPYELEGFGTVAVPVFQDVGLIPIKDRNPDELQFEVNTPQSRIYYFQPEMEDGRMVYQTRILDNYEFYKKIRKDLKLRFVEDLNILNILPQPHRMFVGDQLNFLLTAGEGVLANSYILSLNGKGLINRNYKLEKASFGYQSFANNKLSPVINLDQEVAEFKSQASFSAFFTRTVGRVSYFERNQPTHISHSFKLERDRKKDHFLSYIQGYKKGDRVYSFAQSKSRIILDVYDNVEKKSFSHQLARSTFLPGHIFNETFFPMVIGGKGLKRPAIYVDATQLTSRYIRVWAAEEDGPRSPMSLNLEIPDNCLSRDPVRFGDHGEYAFSLLCLEDKQWVFKYLPVK